MLLGLTKAKPAEHVVPAASDKAEGQDAASETPFSPTIRAKVLFDAVPSSDTELALHVGGILSSLL